jgi:dienelactone hydrolase
MRRIALFSLVVIALAVTERDAHPQQRPALSWERIWIPAGEIKLEANVVKPGGSGPFPVVIISHGSTGRGQVPVSRTMRPDFVASAFLKHGFAVVAPMRRGRGESGGSYDEPYDCDYGAAARGLGNAMKDTDHVIAHLARLPYVDKTRLVLSGQSRGGILSVAYAARWPDRVRGVVNFAGGWTSDGCSEQAGRFNETVFRDAGTAAATARIPMLFLYAGNDSYYSPASIRDFARPFEKDGRVLLRLYGPVGSDGHALFAHPDVWAPDFHEFLRKLGFPLLKAP